MVRSGLERHGRGEIVKIMLRYEHEQVACSLRAVCNCLCTQHSFILT
jgi:hypothetical protein